MRLGTYFKIVRRSCEVRQASKKFYGSQTAFVAFFSLRDHPRFFSMSHGTPILCDPAHPWNILSRKLTLLPDESWASDSINFL
jgi:hypothetical protein